MAFLETERLQIDPVETKDARKIASVNHSDGMQTYGGLKRPSTIEAVRKHIEDNDNLLLTIQHNDDFIGYAGLNVEDEVSRRGSVYIYLLDEKQGNSYGPEALEEIIRHGFDDLNLHKIVGEVFSHNRPSKRMFEKLGFQHECTLREERYKQGKYRDTERYCLFQDDAN